MIELALLSLLFAGGTWAGGWWTLPLVAAVWSLLRRRGPWRAGLAAALAWGGLLALTIPTGPLRILATKLGEIAGLPGWAVVLLSPFYAGLLAWSAARVAAILDSSEAEAQAGHRHLAGGSSSG
jgi:hypothetical protein